MTAPSWTETGYARPSRWWTTMAVVTLPSPQSSAPARSRCWATRPRGCGWAIPCATQPVRSLATPRVVRDGEYLFSLVAPLANTSIGDALAARLTDLPAIAPRQTQPTTAAPAVANIRKPRLNPNNPRVAAMLAIYAMAKQVIRRDVQELDATAARAALNAAYDTFVAAHGPIHTRANQQALAGEPELLFLKSLERDVTQQGGSITAQKADLFARPTVRAVSRVVAGSMSPDEALIRCLDEQGRVDLERIAQLCGVPAQAVAAALSGRIYRLPDSDQYVTADAYLSGNIRQKLTAAAQAAASDPHFTANVTALQAVLPEDLTPGQIAVMFGAPWVPAAIYVQFVCTLIPSFYGYAGGRGTITYHRPLAKWAVADEAYSRRSHQATIEWGTGRMHALDLIEEGPQPPDPGDLRRDRGRRAGPQPEGDLAGAREALNASRSSGPPGSGRTPSAPSGWAGSTTTCSTAPGGATSTARTCRCRASTRRCCGAATWASTRRTPSG